MQKFPCNMKYRNGYVLWTIFISSSFAYTTTVETQAAELAPSCPARMQSCEHLEQNVTCFWKIQRCDGETDCANNMDENNCPYRIPCNTVSGKEGFLCDNGECTLKYWFCDGSDDCTDGSDEELCNSTILDQGISDVVSKQLLAATCNHWVYYQCGFKYPSDFVRAKTWDEVNGYVWTSEDVDKICSEVAATLQCIKQHVPQCFGFEEGVVFYDHVYNILCQQPNITFVKAALPCFNDASTQIAIRYYTNLARKWNFYGPGSKSERKEEVKNRLCSKNVNVIERLIRRIIDQNCRVSVWTNLITKGLAYRIKEPIIRKYGDMEGPFCNMRVIVDEHLWDEYVNPVLKLTDEQRRKLQRGQLL